MKIKYNDGQPCEHKGCLNHISHPCESCGRIAGKGVVLTPDKYDTEITKEDIIIIPLENGRKVKLFNPDRDRM